MSNYINLFYDQSSKDLKNYVFETAYAWAPTCAPRKLCTSH